MCQFGHCHHWHTIFFSSHSRTGSIDSWNRVASIRRLSSAFRLVQPSPSQHRAGKPVDQLLLFIHLKHSGMQVLRYSFGELQLCRHPPPQADPSIPVRGLWSCAGRRDSPIAQSACVRCLSFSLVLLFGWGLHRTSTSRRLSLFRLQSVS